MSHEVATASLVLGSGIKRNYCQGFLRLNDIGSRHDPHLEIIGGRHETLGGHIHMLQN